MLVLTEAAAEAIGELTTQGDLPDLTGLRISFSTGPTNAGVEGWAAELTAVPGPGDEVLKVLRGRLYIDAASVERLADKVLDAQHAEDGDVIFHIRRQTAP